VFGSSTERSSDASRIIADLEAMRKRSSDIHTGRNSRIHRFDLGVWVLRTARLSAKESQDSLVCRCRLVGFENVAGVRNQNEFGG
jgi:hypothetical protein